VTESRTGGPAGTASPDELLAALADPTRRQLLEMLVSGGPATASTLAAGLPITRQAVVKHLAMLQRAGLVTSSKHGRDVRFDVRTARLTQTADWLTSLAAQWDRRLAAIKQIAEAKEGTDVEHPR
jgi:DNA-binding transcriptional ArsR family regulator